jgi:hypothetical protein
MSDEVTPERILAIAASGRFSLDAATAARVARAVNPTVARFTKERIDLALEVEPATFAVVARKEIGR